jgi:hypothetical protein
VLPVRFVLVQGLNPVGMIRVAGNLLQYLNLPCLSKELLRRRTPTGSAANSSLSSLPRNYRI